MLKRSITLLFLGIAAVATAPGQTIDRKALVTRHNPVIKHVDYDAPLTVGNGGFAFTADITGLQTFAAEYHRNGIPTETQARWAWVSDENTNNYTLAGASRDFTQADGRGVPYPTMQSSPAGDWLRKNPRAHPVGQLMLVWDKPDGTAFTPADIQEPEQILNLWTGILTSKFKLGGVPVVVTTACEPNSDSVAVKIDSKWVKRGKLGVRVAFPRGHDINTKNTPALDWSEPEAHRTLRSGEYEQSPVVISQSKKRINAGHARSYAETSVQRIVGGLHYWVTIGWHGGAKITEAGPHDLRLRPLADGPGFLSAVVRFSPHFFHPPPYDAVLAASERYWPAIWRATAAVDFTGSTSPLAVKLEKRIILSRYLMAVQMAGDVPPQESGLTCNTWYGKHHTEMIWWHTAQFALWRQDAALEKNLDWFRSQLPAARELAASRGLKGARWAKMTGPAMRESPGGNPLIVWNQPHPIALAELLYRNSPTPAVLEKYRDIVLETADGMATMLYLDPQRGQYVLGPPLWIVQEIHDQATSQNPAFELAYWRYGLETAQQWRVRLGLPREPHWDDILARLAPLPEKDGKYVALESTPDTWDNIESRHDHPSMLMPLGVLPGKNVDRATMERTLDAVLTHWDWETKIWGWDYPMIAMTAARLGRPETAMEILLRDGPNNRYLPNGHCPQRSDAKLDPNAPPGARKREIAVYLPANGAFLSAVALMVAGWDGSAGEFPGIPKDGTWKVRAEGLARLP